MLCNTGKATQKSTGRGVQQQLPLSECAVSAPANTAANIAYIADHDNVLGGRFVACPPISPDLSLIENLGL